MITIKKNGKSLDMFGGEEIPLTFQANDPLKPITFQAGNSVSFLVPFSKKNKKLFDYANIINSASDLPYTTLETWQVFANGIEIESNATLQIEKITTNKKSKEGFEITIFLGSKTFFDTLAGKTLQDLDLVGFNHTFPTFLQIEATQSNTYTDGYIYAIFQDGQLYTPKETKTEYLYPSIFARPIFDQIIIESGFELSGDFNPDVLNNFILPYGNEADPFEQPKIVAKAPTDLRAKTRTVVDVLATAIPIFGVSNGIYPKFQDIAILPTSGAFEVVNFNKYTIPVDGKYKISLSLILEFDSTGSLGSSPFGLAIISQNGLILDLTPEPQTGSPNIDISETSYKTYLLELEGDFSIGDTFEPIILIDLTVLTLKLHSGSSFEVELQPSQSTLTWEVAPNLPPITQVDFLRHWLMRYNLIFQQHPFEKKITINYLKNILTKQPIDWTHKIDWQRDTFYFRKNGEYAQQNQISFGGNAVSGSVPLVPQLGEGLLLVSDTNLEPTKEIYKSPFQKSGSNFGVAIVPFWEIEGDERNFVLAEYKPQNREPRIVWVEPTYSGLPIPAPTDSDFCKITDSYTLGAFPDVIFRRRLTQFPNTLNFEVGIQNDWDFSKAILQNMKLVEVYAILTELDLQNLDFTKPVYLGGRLTSLFYLAKVEQWQPNKKTKLILFKINQ